MFLVGPSGSGKSTIIKLLTGERPPGPGDDQRLLHEQHHPASDSPMRRTVGVIFQDFRLIGNKTVYDNLSLAMRAVGALRQGEIKSRIPYVLGAALMSMARAWAPASRMGRHCYP